VFKGQIVIDENGVVGQVTALTKKVATVSLITDERQRIPVFVERNRLRMVARGTGDLHELEMSFVAKGSDVRVGDKIVTSGLGNLYPRGYGIAMVTSVEVSAINEFMQIQAKPLASLDRILEVLLISPIQTATLHAND
ncbi:MAG: rod shape-determining protein MreC, partial [Ostreibacterium sp.]